MLHKKLHSIDNTRLYLQSFRRNAFPVPRLTSRAQNSTSLFLQYEDNFELSNEREFEAIKKSPRVLEPEVSCSKLKVCLRWHICGLMLKESAGPQITTTILGRKTEKGTETSISALSISCGPITIVETESAFHSFNLLPRRLSPFMGLVQFLLATTNYLICTFRIVPIEWLMLSDR